MIESDWLHRHFPEVTRGVHTRHPNELRLEELQGRITIGRLHYSMMVHCVAFLGVFYPMAIPDHNDRRNSPFLDTNYRPSVDVYDKTYMPYVRPVLPQIGTGPAIAGVTHRKWQKWVEKNFKYCYPKSLEKGHGRRNR